MKTLTGRRWLLPSLGIALALVAALATYAFAAASAPRPMGGNIALFGGPNGAMCGGDGLLIALEGDGTMTHLGKTTITATNCNFGDLTVESADIADGQATYTAADGSTIVTSYTGSNTQAGADGVSQFTTAHVVVSGTGRFAGASGEWTISGTVNIFTGELLGGVEGWIRY